MTEHRPVIGITGMAVETPLGGNLETFWSNVRNSVSGIRPLHLGEDIRFPEIAGQVPMFDPGECLSASELRRTSRFQQLLLSVALKAVNDAGGLPDPGRTAVILGTGGGGLEAATEEAGELGRNAGRPMDRFILLKCLPNFGAAAVASRVHATGACLTVTTACASALDAVGLASSLLRSNAADAVVVVAGDTVLTRFGVRAFASLNVLSRGKAADAAAASRPFDATRDGIVLAEGAAAIVMERLGDGLPARRDPYALLRGYGSTCDAAHPTAPAADGMAAARCIERALDDAGLLPDGIDHVNAHGTATRLNDVAEARALHTALREVGARVPVTALKSLTGHALGASGMMELCSAVLTLRDQVVPGTANYASPDPECDLNICASTAKARVRTVLKTSFGFGGHNAAAVLSLP